MCQLEFVSQFFNPVQTQNCAALPPCASLKTAPVTDVAFARFALTHVRPGLPPLAFLLPVYKSAPGKVTLDSGRGEPGFAAALQSVVACKWL